MPSAIIPVRQWLALSLCVGVVACDRAPATRTGETATQVPPIGKVDPKGAADPSYVDRLMAATAFDYTQCNRGSRLRGVSGRGDGSSATVVIAVDSSGSMAARSPVAGSRMAEAIRAVDAFAGHLPQDTRVGLVAFGQAGSNRDADKARSCSTPVATLLPPVIGATGLAAAAARLRPTGWTPLAAAITAAAGLAGPRGVVYVVSDGIETCSGDPLAAARDAKAGTVVVNVVGFGIVDRAEEKALQAVATAGGGRYIAVSAGALNDALRLEASRAITGNSVATAQAMQGELSCYYEHMRVQSDATGKRINADQIAGRISSATASSAFKRQDARYKQASDDLIAGHTGLAARREDANAAVVNSLSDKP